MNEIANSQGNFTIIAKLITSDELERLRQVLAYDPQSGLFSWIKRQGRSGERCGTTDTNRYIKIGFNGRRYQAHRLAWIFVYGVNPKNWIDHINGVRDDNRIANLRDVSWQTNSENRRKPRSDGSSGFLGVSLDKRKGTFYAQIEIRSNANKRICKLARGFVTPEAAHAWYVEQKRALHLGGTL